ncbi:DNA-binding response OmpR family regulator [Kaistia dalseonensis]|uniref:DNA-binding response OmpR family regulator n=2 Tax=Kaistia dalseonensis TaxID=410840 RepID=A0ABU0HCT3_9HYPH|nr:DNA-binding response OmpR family regulator [Kaistia dalseonensis]
MVRMLVVDYLNELGYTTIEARDAAAALPVIASSDPIHLLLTDIGLPGMDGHALAQEARKLRPSLKILFATGYASAGMGMPVLGEGMDVVGKPFDMDDLGDRVRTMISGNSANKA